MLKTNTGFVLVFWWGVKLSKEDVRISERVSANPFWQGLGWRRLLAFLVSCPLALQKAIARERARGRAGVQDRTEGVPIRFGGGSYRIRILLYLDVSCVYPVEYMYPIQFPNRCRVGAL